MIYSQKRKRIKNVSGGRFESNININFTISDDDKRVLYFT